MQASKGMRVEELLDKQEIHEVLMRYCRGCDRRDRDLIASAFHPDAIDDHGVKRSGSELADYIMGLDPTWRFMHHMGNELIELEGDVAFVESYFVGYQSFEADGKPLLRERGGRYVDRFERRDGAWKIAHRLVVDDWSRVDEIAGTARDLGRWAGGTFPEDPVYELRGLS